MSPVLSVLELTVAAAAATARVVLASPDQLPMLTELNTEPPIFIQGPRGPWIAALRLR